MDRLLMSDEEILAPFRQTHRDDTSMSSRSREAPAVSDSSDSDLFFSFLEKETATSPSFFDNDPVRPVLFFLSPSHRSWTFPVR